MRVNAPEAKSRSYRWVGYQTNIPPTMSLDMMICMKSVLPSHPVQMSTVFSTLDSLALSDNHFKIFHSFGFFRLSHGSAQPKGIPLYSLYSSVDTPWGFIVLMVSSNDRVFTLSSFSAHHCVVVLLPVECQSLT